MNSVKYPLTLSSTFIWIGFVSAISFMEAWLKFQAPGITILLGLGIGQLVFSALNKVELICALIIGVEIAMKAVKTWDHKIWFYLIPFIILMTQTFWLLPSLDERASILMAKETAPPSNLHFYYVGLEITKVIYLSLFGISLLKQKS